MSGYNPADLFTAAGSAAILVKRDRLPIFRLSGKDSERYLQGRITQNVKTLRPNIAAHSLLLTPQGRIQGKFLLYREEAGFLIISDPLPTPKDEEDFLHSLLQFKVSDDVTVERLSETISVFELVGTRGKEFLATSGYPLPKQALEGCRDGDGTLIIADPLGIAPRYRLFVENALSSKLPDRLHMAPDNEKVFQILRVRLGEPQMDVDLSEKVLGPELDTVKYVSFNKGCYAGQEVVEMATARGRPNRKLCHFSFEGCYPDIEVGATVVSSDGSTAGLVSSLAWYIPEDRTYILALLKTSALDESKSFSVCELELVPV